MVTDEPTHLDLFSGIGGFALAARWAGFRTIGFCEIDKYCQRVLRKNFGTILADTKRIGGWSEAEAGLGVARDVLENGNGQESPNGFVQNCRIFGDIRKLDGRQFREVDLITGGFPCQPFSCAGKRGGAKDNRHLWPEMFRVIDEARPAWVLGENVTGIIGMELDTVLSDLEGIGYATRTFAIPACAVDAKHRRMRVWIVANNAEWRLSKPESQSRNSERIGSNATVRIFTSDYCRWPVESGMGRVAHGIPHRVDRLKGLGNAIVPQLAYQILKEIRRLINYGRPVGTELDPGLDLH